MARKPDLARPLPSIVIFSEVEGPAFPLSNQRSHVSQPKKPPLNLSPTSPDWAYNQYMKSLTRRLVLALLITFLLSTAAFAATPIVGAEAPNFSLQTPDDKTLSLADLTANGPVALILLRGYPGYQCPYCVKQVHDYVENAQQLSAAGIQVLLVYPGPPAQLSDHAKEFLAQQNQLPANIHLVVDPDYQMTNLYGLRWDAPKETAYPSTFLISKKGTIVWSKISTGHGDRTTAQDVLTQQAALTGK